MTLVPLVPPTVAIFAMDDALATVVEGEEHGHSNDSNVFFSFTQRVPLGSNNKVQQQGHTRALMTGPFTHGMLAPISGLTSDIALLQKELENAVLLMATSGLDDCSLESSSSNKTRLASFTPPGDGTTNIAPRLSLSPPPGPFVSLPFLPPPRAFFEESNVAIDEKRRQLELKALDDAWLKHMADAIREGRSHKPRPIIISHTPSPARKKRQRKKHIADPSLQNQVCTIDKLLASKSEATIRRMNESAKKLRMRRGTKSAVLSARFLPSMVHSESSGSGRPQKARQSARPLNPIDQGVRVVSPGLGVGGHGGGGGKALTFATLYGGNESRCNSHNFSNRVMSVGPANLVRSASGAKGSFSLQGSRPSPGVVGGTLVGGAAAAAAASVNSTKQRWKVS